MLNVAQGVGGLWLASRKELTLPFAGHLLRLLSFLPWLITDFYF